MAGAKDQMWRSVPWVQPTTYYLVGNVEFGFSCWWARLKMLSSGLLLCPGCWSPLPFLLNVYGQLPFTSLRAPNALADFSPQTELSLHWPVSVFLGGSDKEGIPTRRSRIWGWREWGRSCSISSERGAQHLYIGSSGRIESAAFVSTKWHKLWIARGLLFTEIVLMAQRRTHCTFLLYKSQILSLK